MIYSKGEKNTVIGYHENSQQLLAQDIDYGDFQKWRLIYDDINFAYQIVSVANSSLNVRYDGNIQVGQGDDKKSFWYLQTTSNGALLFRSKIRSEILITLSGNQVYPSNLSNNSDAIQEFGLVPIKNTLSITDGRYLISSLSNKDRSLSWFNQNETIVDHVIFHVEAEWELRYSSNKQAYTIMNAKHERDGLYFSYEGSSAGKKDIIDRELRNNINDEENRKYWYVEYRFKGGGYLIRNKFNPNIILFRPNDSLNSRIITVDIRNYREIPDNCLWTVNKIPRS